MKIKDKEGNIYIYNFCGCFKDDEFSEIKEINHYVNVGRLTNPYAYGYPEVVNLPLDLFLNYCPQCGHKLRELKSE